ncbi:MAG: DNA polymerase IV [Clostridia bacterium]|nr:DNA polymerase IV [Clostridia bacterium]
MIDYTLLPEHRILCIDIKSFYASCECVARGLDPLNSYLAVIGDKNIASSIVLAASPKLKKDFGIKTGSRLFEIPRQPFIHLAEARMSYYLEMSMKVINLLNNFVPLEFIHIYSVDECWVCLDGTEKLWGDTWTAAQKIKNAIFQELGLPCCIGIGPNKFLAKVILDVEAKKSPLGIAECRYKDVPHKLWDKPVEQIWGIGSRMKRNLNNMGIITLGDLAHYPLPQLKKRFGIMGEQLYNHAWGIDLSPVTSSNYQEQQKSFGQGITLARDYTRLNEIQTVILELCEEVTRRMRQFKKCGKTVSLALRYGYSHGGGFHSAHTITTPTNITKDIYNTCLHILKENYRGQPVRKIYVTVGNLTDDQTIQTALFQDRLKEHKIGYIQDEIRQKFGNDAILRAVSFTGGGTMLERAKKIGGHKA